MTGYVYIEDGASSEYLEYTGISGLDITLAGVTAFEHTGSEPIYFSLRRGLHLSPDDIDITLCETVRDNFFVTDSFEFELFGIGKGLEGTAIYSDTLKFIEQELLLPNNLRIIQTTNAKVGLGVLDQTSFAGSSATFDGSNTVRKSEAYNVENSELANVVTLKYGYDHETENYTSSYTLEDAQSISDYGRRQAFVVESQGIPAGAGGDAIAIDRVTRWLNRLATPRATVELATFFNTYENFPADQALVVQSFPSAAGDRDFRQDLEILNKKVNHRNQQITWTLQSTSETGVRVGYISGTATIASIAPSLFTYDCTVGAGEGANFSAGDTVDFWAGNVLQGQNRVVSVTGDVIVFSKITAGATPPTAGDVIKKCAYATGNSLLPGPTDSQKRYGFIVDSTTEIFASDGTGAYKITF